MKTEYKWFFLPDYEKQEAYLNEMSNKGLELVDIKTILVAVGYVFKETDPKDMIYRIDFHTEKDEDSYIQMYQDYGWTFIKKYNDFYYFKKEGNQEDLEIFSDDESRYEMITKIKDNKLKVAITTTLASLLIFILCSKRIPSFILVIYIVILMLDLYSILRCIKGFKALEKKYGKNN